MLEGILGLLWIIVVVWAILKTVRSAEPDTTKLLWIIVLLLLPVIGLLLWLFIGPGRGVLRSA